MGELPGHKFSVNGSAIARHLFDDERFYATPLNP